MSTQTKNEAVIDEFLSEVESKLPFWLRDNKEEVKEILEELKNHIWDKVVEIAGENEPAFEDIEQAIRQMGRPAEIANEYKRRGKPKFFITEELAPLYVRTLVIALVAQFFLNIIGVFFNIGTGAAGRRFFSGLAISSAITLILITILFTYLSMEGYYPENLQNFTTMLPSFFQSLHRTVRKESAEVKGEVVEEAALEPRTTEQLHPESKVKILAVHAEQSQVVTKDTSLQKPKRVVKYKEYSTHGSSLSNGVFEVMFGIAIIVLVFLPVFEFISQPGFYPMNWWLFAYGATIATVGLINILKSIVGKIVRAQQGLTFLKIFPIAARVPLFLVLLMPIASFGPYTAQMMELFQLLLEKLNILLGLGWTFEPAKAMLALKIIVYFYVTINSLKIFNSLIRIVKLEFEGFPVREKEVIEYR